MHPWSGPDGIPIVVRVNRFANHASCCLLFYDVDIDIVLSVVVKKRSITPRELALADGKSAAEENLVCKYCRIPVRGGIDAFDCAMPCG